MCRRGVQRGWSLESISGQLPCTRLWPDQATAPWFGSPNRPLGCLRRLPGVGERVLLGERAAARASTNPDCVLLNPVERMRHNKAVLGGQSFAQNEVAGWWLKEVCTRAQQHRHEEISAVMVCVPSPAVLDVSLWFDFATTEAGIARSSACASTSAAALGVVALTRIESGLLGVVDVGASQVEAMVAEVAKGSVKLLSRACRSDFGALSIDHKVAEAFVCDVASLETFRNLPGAVLQMLLQACEGVRCDLSQVTEAKLSVPFLGPMLGCPDLPDWVLDRFRLESLARPVVDAIDAACREAMQLAGLSPAQVSFVAAVGGLSRMPLVRRDLQVLFDKAPLSQVDPEAAAACGAALLGAGALGWVPAHVDDSHVRQAPAVSDKTVEPSVPPHVSVGAMLAVKPPVVSHPPETEASKEGAEGRDSQVHLAGSSVSSSPALSSGRPSIGTMIRVASSAQPTPPESSRPSRAPGVDIPRSGQFRNALSASDILALPFTRAMTEADVSPPALPVLLMHYGRCKNLDALVTLSIANGEVTLRVAETKAVVGSPRERAAFLDAFLWPEGSYRIETEGIASHANHNATESLAKTSVDGIRNALGTLADDEIVQAFGEHFTMAPKVTKRGLAMADALEFWVGERRFLEYRCDGSIVTQDALKAGGISEATALRVLFVIEMLGQLRWEPPPRKIEVSLREQVEALALKVDRGDAFDALGVHWSVSEEEAQAAHDALVRRYGSGSKEAKAAPEAAGRIVAKAREALPILLDRRKRIALLRRTRPDLDFQAVTDLMEKRAVSLAMKGQEGAAEQARRIQREVAPLSRQSGFDRGVMRMPSTKPEEKTSKEKE